MAFIALISLRKSKRFGYSDVNTPPVADLCETGDNTLFSRITSKRFHVTFFISLQTFYLHLSSNNIFSIVKSTFCFQTNEWMDGRMDGWMNE